MSKRNRIVVNIYPEESGNRWECVQKDHDEINYLDSDILVEIMKRKSKDNCLGPFPHIVVLPEGVFKETGSGFAFGANCRDVCYDELTEHEYEVWKSSNLLLNTEDRIRKFIRDLMWTCFRQYVWKLKMKIFEWQHPECVPVVGDEYCGDDPESFDVVEKESEVESN